jgi:hypothetical protein
MLDRSKPRRSGLSLCGIGISGLYNRGYHETDMRGKAKIPRNSPQLHISVTQDQDV